jgi:hypothetical protein
MSTDRQITPNCIAVALYGTHGDSSAMADFYNELIKWFMSIGCRPDKLSVRGHGHSGKPNEFENAHSRLCKKGLSGVEEFGIYSMLPGGVTPLVDWWAIATLRTKYHPCFILSARTSVATFEDEGLMQLIQDCASKLNPSYGIGLHREHDKGPAFYLTGLNYTTKASFSDEELEEAAAVAGWGDIGLEKEVYKSGLLRGVYPRNYLSAPQLDRRIGHRTLESWISSDPAHGNLVNLDGRMKLWKVNVQQIAAIQDELLTAGAIFNWKEYV